MYWVLSGVLLGVAIVCLLVARAAARTLSGFVAERRALREQATAPRPAYPADRDGWVALREADTLLVGAEAGLRDALRRARWELLGLGNPDARQYVSISACGDLLQAQRAIRHGAARLRLAIDPGDDVPLVDDPLRALALRGAWALWVVLMLLPAPVRGLYRYVALRRELLPLLAAAEELQEVVGTFRRTSEPAPPRSAPVWARAAAVAA